MKKTLVFLLCTAIMSGISAQNTINDPNAEKRNVGSFTIISISHGIDLYLSQGSESVAVSAADTRYRDNIKTEVKDNVLKIWYEKDADEKWGSSTRKLKAYVSVNTLKKLTASGGSDIDIVGSMKVQNLVLDISGGSDFKGSIEGSELDIEASGGSDVDISGRFNKLSIEASGGSDFNGYGLTTEYCNLEASGGSDVQITVNKELTANASGGSDVKYKGNAVVTNLKTNGSSSIKKSAR